MIKFFLTLIVVVFASQFFAQNNTTGSAVTNEVSTKKNTVLLIPFEPRMYISDIDRDLAVKNELTYKDIKEKFRSALDQNLFITFKSSYNALSFYTIDPKESYEELSYIYNSIGYKYEVMPEENKVENNNIGKKLINRFKKKEEEPKEAGIYNGQVVAPIDDREKYMKTNITNDNLITTLNQKYQAKYYLFINELDIRRSAENVYQASNTKVTR